MIALGALRVKLSQEYILKIKIADDITSHFNPKNLEFALNSIANRLTSLFTYPETIFIKIGFGNQLHGPGNLRETRLLFQKDFPVLEKQSLKLQVFVSKDRQEIDIEFEESLIELIFRSIAKQITHV